MNATSVQRAPIGVRWGRDRLRLAVAHAARGDPAAALLHAEAAIDHLSAAHELASAHVLVATASRELGDLPAAVGAQRAAVAFLDDGDGGGVERALAYIALGDLLRFCGALDEAEQVLELALRLGDDLPAEHTRSARAGALTALGIVYKDTGHYHAARAAYGEALCLVAAQGPDQPAAADVWHNMAALAHARRRPRDAVAAGSRAVAIRRAALGASHRLVALDLAVVGAAYLDADRVDDAEAAFARALEIFRSRAPADRYEVGVNLSNLAACRLRRGDPVGAAALFRQGLAITRSILPEQHPEIARQLDNLAVAVAAGT